MEKKKEKLTLEHDTLGLWNFLMNTLPTPVGASHQ
jgi:hypothetical protein